MKGKHCNAHNGKTY